MRSKGFTLIELLAVIVILAIIALIAVPIILGIIGDTKENASIRSTELYLDAVTQAIVRKNLIEEFNPTWCDIQSDGNLSCDAGDLIVEVNGDRPTCGTMDITDGIISNLLAVSLGGYELETDDNGKIIVKGNEPSQCATTDKSTPPEAPDLYTSGLVPVKWNGSAWMVTTNTDNEWYNYSNQEWANAVILSDTGKSKTSGETLDLETDVTAMFVWIPRYEYKIAGKYGKGGTSATNPGEIDVRFVSVETTTPTRNYRMHPAFTFGDEELKGIWIGKFETHHTTLSSSTTSNNLSCTNENCATADNLRILPNVVSLGYNRVSNFFYAARSMSREGNAFGIDGSKIDTHMAKNSEWGAAAYLSQSTYGKYGAKGTEVYINNNSNYITGCAGDTAASPKIDSCNAYDTERGQEASTTGNITGIYDMNGGAWEYVMGVYNKLVKYSGFSTLPDEKYFDNYAATDCDGEACYERELSETAGWYEDYQTLVDSTNSWFRRGGFFNDKSNAGVFGFHSTDGSSIYSFRVVLTSATS